MTEEKGSDSKQGWFCQQPVVLWDSQTALAVSLGFLGKGNLELASWEVGIAFRMRLVCPREWERVGYSCPGILVTVKKFCALFRESQRES